MLYNQVSSEVREGKEDYQQFPQVCILQEVKVCGECNEGKPILDTRKYQSRDKTSGVSLSVQEGEKRYMAVKEI